MAAGVRVFFFDKGNMKMDELAALVAAYLPRMRLWAVKRPGPFFGKITGNGLEQVYPRRSR